MRKEHMRPGHIMTHADQLPLHQLIQGAVAQYGPRRVLLLALLAALHHKPSAPDVSALSNHLRRDVGLPPAEPSRTPLELLR